MSLFWSLPSMIWTQWLWSPVAGAAAPPQWVGPSPAPRLSHCCLSPSLFSPRGEWETNWGGELKNLQTTAWKMRRQECPLHVADGGGRAGREKSPYQHKVVLRQILHGNTVRRWLEKCLLRHGLCRPMVLLGAQPLGWHYLNGEKCIAISNEQLITVMLGAAGT